MSGQNFQYTPFLLNRVFIENYVSFSINPSPACVRATHLISDLIVQSHQLAIFFTTNSKILKKYSWKNNTIFNEQPVPDFNKIINCKKDRKTFT